MSTAEENLNRVMCHLGWGDPSEGLWFIGIEEGGEWGDSPSVVEEWFRNSAVRLRTEGEATYECPNEGASSSGGRSRVRYWEERIVSRILERTSRGAYWRGLPLWSEGSRTFHANLYPLAKPSCAAWPEHYEHLFGLGAHQRGEYTAKVSSKRFDLIQSLRTKSQPAAIVCFGRTFWTDFGQLLALRAQPDQQSAGKLYVDASNRVVLSPFFGYWHMNASLACRIADILVGWGVRL